MLDTLKFVGGAVAKKELVPGLTSFSIRGGRVTGYNGTLAISAPLPMDIECQPEATALIKAIANCKDAVTMALLPSGNLRVVSGKFRTSIRCYPTEIPSAQPEGQVVPVNGEELQTCFHKLMPFVGTDASRPWSNGVLLRGKSAFVTNNATLIEYWLGTPFPHEVNLPTAAVKEVMRVGKPPIAVQMNDNNITFHFEGDRWIRTQVLSTQWPDLARILNREHNAQPVPADFFKGVQSVADFVDTLGRVYLCGNEVRTVPTGDEGAIYSLEGEHDMQGIYMCAVLEPLRTVVEKIDFSMYPAPCLFFGKNLRGAVVGLRPEDFDFTKKDK